MYSFRFISLGIFKRNMSGKLTFLLYLIVLYFILIQLYLIFLIKLGLPRSTPLETEYDLQKVLLISKITRLEMEQQSYTNPIDLDPREVLLERGSGYLIKSHEEHKKFETAVIQSLDKLQVEVKIIDR